jgi:cytochrome c
MPRQAVICNLPLIGFRWRSWQQAAPPTRRPIRAGQLGGNNVPFPVRAVVLAMVMPFAITGSCAAADVAAGKTIFEKCALCHTAEPGKNKVGPSLFGIVGRHSASLKSYDYSDAMKNFNHVWTPQTLNTYLTDPRAMVPGTKMIFPGIKDAKDRANLIAYLGTLK